MIDPKAYLNSSAHPGAPARHEVLDQIADDHREAARARERDVTRKKKWQGYSFGLASLLSLFLALVAVWDKVASWVTAWLR